MLEITTAAGVQPSTLYQYFKHKEDIALAIASEIASDFQHRFQSQLFEHTTGLQKIVTLLDIMSADLETRLEKVRFMAEFDVLYAHKLPAESLLHLHGQISPNFLDELHSWIATGIADGSMRPELDPEITLHAVLNAVVGTQRRLAFLGNKVETEYGRPLGALFREAMRVMLLGLSAEPVSQRAPKPGKTGAKNRSTSRTPRRRKP